MQAMSNSWSVRIPCTRAEAEALNDDVPELAMLDPAPAILTQELVPFDDAAWELVAYFDRKPDQMMIKTLKRLVPSAKGTKPVVEALGAEDWVTMSQAAIEPLSVGRFYVHTQSNKGQMPKAAIPFQIEASQAFGTGSHETTSGCLAMLDAMKRSGKRFDHVVDIGTGTGLLAFAARHLWPRAYLTASDIDPVSIDVTAANADLNAVPLGHSMGQIGLCVASGTDHALINARAPYDLVIANILAGPLIELAQSLNAVTREGGSLILAGLLNTQADAVLRAYRQQGYRLIRRRDSGDWPCLWLIKRHSYAWRRPIRASGSTSQPPGDFGTW